LAPSCGEVVERQRRGQLEPRLEGRRMERRPDRIGQRRDPDQRQQRTAAADQHSVECGFADHL
jgi:hypothetical protein